ncbi:MAG: hypothetical protein D6805_06350 [Planctomycetota bacterium]|nr:MAG: hypothetical protein D6805_06350 [Planctomycetota bacterium]
MYLWKELRLNDSLERSLRKLEEEFIHSVAEMITQSILRNIRRFSREEVEAIISHIQQDPHIINYYTSNVRKSQGFS